MFITIQNTTFNIKHISYITINKVSKNVLEVRTCDSHDNYHSFEYPDEKAALKAFKEINRDISTQQYFYNK